ncbi:hypothetical protein [Actinomadura sp. NBRC 104425]|uniref:hypothetical protein n=1 Tax=Actinomadura sp. NBRC 104425 TaxID=3032204 RepID=UPI002552D510|nr:hypothetical protein [Actinomadura sp. NBRC 104425]
MNANEGMAAVTGGAAALDRADVADQRNRPAGLLMRSNVVCAPSARSVCSGGVPAMPSTRNPVGASRVEPSIDGIVRHLTPHDGGMVADMPHLSGRQAPDVPQQRCHVGGGVLGRRVVGQAMPVIAERPPVGKSSRVAR